MRRAALLLVAAALGAQDTRPDFAADVVAACEHKKYGVRQAAAKKLADGGDAAVPAIRARQASHGKDRIPQTVVEAVAGSDQRGEATVGLLRDWAEDRDFYWRAQALKGLANRKLAACEALFRAAVADPFHVYRVQGLRGLWLLGAADAKAAADRLLVDEDPRARVAAAAFLLEQGDASGIGNLKAALHDAHETFLGDPWAMREAQLALPVLKARHPETAWTLPEPPAQARGSGFTGGVELRSCRNGDLFLRWTAAGGVVAGLRQQGPPVALSADRWQGLGGPPLAGKPQAVHGEVICDYLQLVWREPGKADAPEWRQKFAPGALPAPLGRWLEGLAAALDETDAGRPLAGALRTRLPQFATPANR